jgi:hypothetical protein
MEDKQKEEVRINLIDLSINSNREENPNSESGEFSSRHAKTESEASGNSKDIE